MNISLTPTLENYLRQKVETGMYNSTSEVVREALRLLEARDAAENAKLEALRKDITAGISSLNEGQGSPFNIDTIKEKARKQWEND